MYPSHQWSAFEWTAPLQQFGHNKVPSWPGHVATATWFKRLCGLCLEESCCRQAFWNRTIHNNHHIIVNNPRSFQLACSVQDVQGRASLPGRTHRRVQKFSWQASLNLNHTYMLLNILQAHLEPLARAHRQICLLGLGWGWTRKTLLRYRVSECACISVSFVCLSCLNLAAVMQAQQQSTAPRPFSQPRIFEGTGQRLGQWERSKPYLTLRHTLAALGRWSLLQCLTFPHLQCEMGLHATWCDLMSLPK